MSKYYPFIVIKHRFEIIAFILKLQQFRIEIKHHKKMIYITINNKRSRDVAPSYNYILIESSILAVTPFLLITYRAAISPALLSF